MSTKEILISMIDNMTEQQMQELIFQLNEKKDNSVSANEVAGILSKYANPDLIPLEEGAWERAVVEKYEDT